MPHPGGDAGVAAGGEAMQSQGLPSGTPAEQALAPAPPPPRGGAQAVGKLRGRVSFDCIEAFKDRPSQGGVMKLDDVSLEELRSAFQKATGEEAAPDGLIRESLNIEAFTEAFRSVFELSDMELHEIFLRIDVNANGMVGWDELVSFLLTNSSVANDIAKGPAAKAYQESHLKVPCQIGSDPTRWVQHSDTVTRVVFHPRHSTVFSGSQDGTVKMWRATTLEHERTILNGSAWITDMIYIPPCLPLNASGFIVTASIDRVISVLDSNTGDLIRSYRGKRKQRTGGPRSEVAYRHEFSVPQQYDQRSVDTDELSSLLPKSIVKLRQKAINDEAQKKVGQAFAQREGGCPVPTSSCLDTQTATISNVMSHFRRKERIDMIVMEHLESTPWALGHVHAGTHDYLLVAGDDAIIRVYDVTRDTFAHNETSAPCLNYPGHSIAGGGARAGASQHLTAGWHTGHSGAVTKLLVAASLDSIVTSGVDTTLRLHDIETGGPLRVLGVPSLGDSADTPGSHPGLGLRGGGGGGLSSALMIDRVDTDAGHQKAVLSFAWCEERRLLASCGAERNVLVWNPFISKPIVTLKGHRAPVLDACFNTEENHLVTLSADKVLKVWDLRTFQPIQTIVDQNRYPGQKIAVGALAYDARNRRVVTASTRLHAHSCLSCKFRSSGGGEDQDKEAQPSGGDGGAAVAKQGDGGGGSDKAFPPSAAKGAADAGVAVPASGPTLLQNIPRHDSTFRLIGTLYSAAFQQLLTVDEHRIIIWNARNQKPIINWSVPGGISSIAFDDNERRLLTGTRDGTVLIWNYSNAQFLKTCANIDGNRVFDEEAVLAIEGSNAGSAAPPPQQAPPVARPGSPEGMKVALESPRGGTPGRKPLAEASSPKPMGKPKGAFRPRQTQAEKGGQPNLSTAVLRKRDLLRKSMDTDVAFCCFVIQEEPTTQKMIVSGKGDRVYLYEDTDTDAEVPFFRSIKLNDSDVGVSSCVFLPPNMLVVGTCSGGLSLVYLAEQGRPTSIPRRSKVRHIGCLPGPVRAEGRIKLAEKQTYINITSVDCVCECLVLLRRTLRFIFASHGDGYISVWDLPPDRPKQCKGEAFSFIASNEKGEGVPSIVANDAETKLFCATTAGYFIVYDVSELDRRSESLVMGNIVRTVGHRLVQCSITQLTYLTKVAMLVVSCSNSTHLIVTEEGYKASVIGLHSFDFSSQRISAYLPDLPESASGMSLRKHTYVLFLLDHLEEAAEEWRRGSLAESLGDVGATPPTGGLGAKGVAGCLVSTGSLLWPLGQNVAAALPQQTCPSITRSATDLMLALQRGFPRDFPADPPPQPPPHPEPPVAGGTPTPPPLSDPTVEEGALPAGAEKPQPAPPDTSKPGDGTAAQQALSPSPPSGVSKALQPGGGKGKGNPLPGAGKGGSALGTMAAVAAVASAHRRTKNAPKLSLEAEFREALESLCEKLPQCVTLEEAVPAGGAVSPPPPALLRFQMAGSAQAPASQTPAKSGPALLKRENRPSPLESIQVVFSPEPDARGGDARYRGGGLGHRSFSKSTMGGGGGGVASGGSISRAGSRVSLKWRGGDGGGSGAGSGVGFGEQNNTRPSAAGPTGVVVRPPPRCRFTDQPLTGVETMSPRQPREGSSDGDIGPNPNRSGKKPDPAPPRHATLGSPPPPRGRVAAQQQQQQHITFVGRDGLPVSHPPGSSTDAKSIQHQQSRGCGGAGGSSTRSGRGVGGGTASGSECGVGGSSVIDGDCHRELGGSEWVAPAATPWRREKDELHDPNFFYNKMKQRKGVGGLRIFTSHFAGIRSSSSGAGGGGGGTDTTTAPPQSCSGSSVGGETSASGILPTGLPQASPPLRRKPTAKYRYPPGMAGREEGRSGGGGGSSRGGSIHTTPGVPLAGETDGVGGVGGAAPALFASNSQLDLYKVSGRHWRYHDEEETPGGGACEATPESSDRPSPLCFSSSSSSSPSSPQPSDGSEVGDCGRKRRRVTSTSTTSTHPTPQQHQLEVHVGDSPGCLYHHTTPEPGALCLPFSGASHPMIADGEVAVALREGRRSFAQAPPLTPVASSPPMSWRAQLAPQSPGSPRRSPRGGGGGGGGVAEESPPSPLMWVSCEDDVSCASPESRKMQRRNRLGGAGNDVSLAGQSNQAQQIGSRRQSMLGQPTPLLSRGWGLLGGGGPLGGGGGGGGAAPKPGGGGAEVVYSVSQGSSVVSRRELAMRQGDFDRELCSHNQRVAAGAAARDGDPLGDGGVQPGGITVTAAGEPNPVAAVGKASSLAAVLGKMSTVVTALQHFGGPRAGEGGEPAEDAEKEKEGGGCRAATPPSSASSRSSSAEIQDRIALLKSQAACAETSRRSKKFMGPGTGKASRGALLVELSEVSDPKGRHRRLVTQGLLATGASAPAPGAAPATAQRGGVDG